jgi:hypothetical protein
MSSHQVCLRTMFLPDPPTGFEAHPRQVPEIVASYIAAAYTTDAELLQELAQDPNLERLLMQCNYLLVVTTHTHFLFSHYPVVASRPQHPAAATPPSNHTQPTLETPSNHPRITPKSPLKPLLENLAVIYHSTFTVTNH